MQPNAGWADQIPDDIWSIYREAIIATRNSETPFALGGSFALAAHTGTFRATKDLDIYITPDRPETMVSAIAAAGFTDLYDEQTYDRAWIYRANRDGCIVDVIWAMANQAAAVDASWLSASPQLEIRG
jgi:hypothetical protein